MEGKKRTKRRSKRPTRLDVKCDKKRLAAAVTTATAMGSPKASTRHDLQSALGRFKPRNPMEEGLKSYLRHIVYARDTYWEHNHKLDLLCTIFKNIGMYEFMNTRAQEECLSSTLDFSVSQLQSDLQRDILNADTSDIHCFLNGKSISTLNMSWIRWKTLIGVHHQSKDNVPHLPPPLEQITLVNYATSFDFVSRHMTATISLSHNGISTAFLEQMHDNGQKYTDLYATWTYAGSVLAPTINTGDNHQLIWHIYGASLWLISEDMHEIPTNLTLQWFLASPSKVRPLIQVYLYHTQYLPDLFYLSKR
ncbi:hypothetical protein FRC14_005645 [Serendipita sp. 396]|nr:hypothetical protein FRC14_005645 [Serendipita sp. 396]KAG8780177.1 hypothetical protein FRC15_009697 [Serendipita sp. 397]KAG8850037.1 hypothetical protein FRB91_009401 [Serendipita sp. 411]KAG8865722.1 hypothetical protein FRC20_009553 [Serendipita sp. 405]